MGIAADVAWIAALQDREHKGVTQGSLFEMVNVMATDAEKASDAEALAEAARNLCRAVLR
jgi:hypothetical protein